MIQAQATPLPPAPPSPSAPALAPAGGVGFAQAQLTSPEQVQAAYRRLEDLRRELQDAAERRNSIASRLRSADVDARPGYLGRLQVLDERIISIEREITQTVSQLGRATPEALNAATASVSQGPDPNLIVDRVSSEIVPIIAILSIFVFMPLALAISRLIWKRATNAPRVSAASDPATQQKLDHLQQAVDTIAIEVERISEGQRFVTKLMSERSLGAGAAEPVRAAKSAIPSERG